MFHAAFMRRLNASEYGIAVVPFYRPMSFMYVYVGQVRPRWGATGPSGPGQQGSRHRSCDAGHHLGGYRPPQTQATTILGQGVGHESAVLRTIWRARC